MLVSTTGENGNTAEAMKTNRLWQPPVWPFRFSVNFHAAIPI